MRLLFCALLFFSVFACNNKVEIGNSKDVDPETIYYDYKVWAEEGRDDVTVMLQYRFAGEDGTSLILNEPSKVTIDGEALKMDSARLTGVYYEMVKPVKNFEGNHTIVFTDKNKKEHKEEFSFKPFTLAAEFPEKVKKEAFVVKLKGFPAEPTRVRLSMVDTSFSSKDVNAEMVIERGELKITDRQLANLTKGPIVFEIYMEEEKPLKNASKEGGRLTMTYGLKRHFELVETGSNVDK